MHSCTPPYSELANKPYTNSIGRWGSGWNVEVLSKNVLFGTPHQHFDCGPLKQHQQNQKISPDPP